MSSRHGCLLIISLALLSLSSASTDPVLYDIYPFIRVYRNGTIQRFIGQGYLPASTDPATGVHSKDVTFAANPTLTARLYLPRNAAAAGRKLPLLVYFHGGGFFIESAFSPTYHHHLNALVAKSRVIAVSVNYRLAPENPLPAAFEDSWRALKWTFSHCCGGGGGDPWLKKFADFGNFYLGGDSAGATLAHNMAMRVGSGIPGLGIRLQGMFLNCPYFLGKKAIGEESTAGNAYAETMNQRLWLHAYPNSTGGLDDPLVNPGMDPGLKRVGCERVLVYVAGKDVLRFRGWYYKEVMEKSGWGGVVKVVEAEGEEHDFGLADPTRKNSIAMLKLLAAFLNHGMGD